MTEIALTMTSLAYRQACRYANPYLAAIHNDPFDLAYGRPKADGLDVGGVGVYVACDARNRVDYVGSVCRQRLDGLARRISEHEAKDPERWALWRKIWWIPMHTNAPKQAVRRAEGIIGRALLPPRNQRLPSCRG